MKASIAATESRASVPVAHRVARPARMPRPAQDESAYVSVSETRALLADSLAARNARLAGEDMVSTDEAALLAGTSRVTINAWIAKGRCIGLAQTKRGFRVPAWQFEPRIWDVLPALSAALGAPNGWQLLGFLETPNGALGGITPRVAIERGDPARVLTIAAQEGL
ncbi:hypothetical protein BH11PSE9_BH11PSE9_04070 [soil metagenome]